MRGGPAKFPQQGPGAATEARDPPASGARSVCERRAEGQQQASSAAVALAHDPTAAVPARAEAAPGVVPVAVAATAAAAACTAFGPAFLEWLAYDVLGLARVGLPPVAAV